MPNPAKLALGLALLMGLPVLAVNMARWGSNGTVGSEFTGLYFDWRNPHLAYVNIQHPDSDVDRTIEISAAPAFERGNKN